MIVSYLMSLKFGEELGHVAADMSQVFKVKGSKSRSHGKQYHGK